MDAPWVEHDTAREAPGRCHGAKLDDGPTVPAGYDNEKDCDDDKMTSPHRPSLASQARSWRMAFV
jgi:hypothetical protein